MKVKLLYALAFGASIAITGCHTQESYTPPVNYSAQQQQTDAKILAAVMVIDKNEIAAAGLAERKSTNPAVRSFAAYLNKAHSQNLMEIQALSQKTNLAPVNGEIARMLQRSGKQTAASLSHLNNGAFDKAYIHAMVKGHAAAMQLLNQRLIPLAVNPLVKQQLENTRHHVNMHLQKALAFEGKLRNSR